MIRWVNMRNQGKFGSIGTSELTLAETPGYNQ